MVKKKIKKIVIVGSNSTMAKSFVKRNSDKYDFIKIGRRKNIV